MSFQDKLLKTIGGSQMAPKRRQLAALCYRKGEEGREILLVTSSRGRWILPKGWPIDGLKDPQAAMVEAWEEGGIKKGKARRKPVGSYIGLKTFSNGKEELCLVQVYEVEVEKTSKNYPEAEERDRVWVTPKKAAKMVEDQGLKTLLKGL